MNETSMSETKSMDRRTGANFSFIVSSGLLERFWAKVKKQDGDDACWAWTGATRDGYGAIKVAKLVVGTHVLSWRITNDGAEVPERCEICHSCDNRKCVRPSHLFVGSHSENMIDALKKGRLDDSRRLGVDACNSVLTEEIVRFLRERYVPRLFGATRLAREVERRFGVRPSRHTIEDAVFSGSARRTWKHV